MLGAAIRATGLVSVDSIVAQLKTRFGRIAEGNIKAFKRAYEECACEE
jgi:Pyruvate/2-oxoacid:ferredoxin oxidoreductase gamma subunit